MFSSRVITFLIFCLPVLVSHTYGVCDFPTQWQGKSWLTKLDATTLSSNIVPILVTYNAGSAESWNALLPGNTENYQCDAFTANGDDYYYKRRSGSSGEYSLCVAESLHAGLIIHRQKEVATNVQCSADAVSTPSNLFSLYIPVSSGSPGPNFEWSTALTYELPFKVGYYKVKYATDEANQNRCENESSSVASVSSDIIGITTCESSQSGYPTPYSGRMQAVADFSATELGEPNDDNGRVLILSYLSPDEKGFYCARYKKNGDNEFEISLDISSQSELQCMKGARYDWFGVQQSRTYLKFVFTFYMAFSTTTTLAPPTTSTTVAPGDEPAYVQFTLLANYTIHVPEPEPFGNAIKKDIADDAGVDAARIDVVEVEKGPGDNTVVTFILASANGNGSNVDGAKNAFRVAIQPSSGNAQMTGPDGVLHDVQKPSYYSWRLTDAQCVALECPSASPCWVSDGDYACHCGQGNNQVTCVTAPDSGEVMDEQTKITIIAVCVVFCVCLIVAVVLVIFCRHCRKQKDAESGYDHHYGDPETEKRDREMYSTIGKKPKAYHDKQIVTPNENAPSTVEMTGLHG